MARAETVALSFEADLSDLKRDLAQLPGITEKEARGMVKGLEKGFLKAEKAAEKAAKNSGKAWVKSSGKIEDASAQTGEGLKKLGQAAGGPIGEAAGRIEALSEAVVALNNPVGLAVIGAGALAAGYVALAAAIGAAVLVADDFLEDLEEIGRAPVIAPEQIAAIQRTNVALEAMGVVGKEATVILAGEFAPALEQAATLTLALGLAALDTFRVFAESIDTLELVGNAIIEGLLGPLDMVGEVLLAQVEILATVADAVGADGLAGELRQATAEIEALRASINVGELLDLTTASITGAGAFGEYGDQARELIDQMLATDEAVTKTTASIENQGEVLRSTSAAYEESARAAAVVDDAMDTLNGSIQTSIEDLKSQQETLDQNLEKELERIDKAAEGHAKGSEVYQASLDAKLEAQERYARDSAVVAEKLARLEMKLAAEQATYVINTGQMLMEAQIASQDTTTDAGLAAAKKAYGLQKSMAVVQAMIDGALAAQKAIALFGPPPSPAGIAGLAMAAAQTAATMATISMQPAPSFPMGGLIPADHGMVGVSPGEAILNRGAVEQLGPQGVDELNRGRRTGPEVVVVNRYEHRIFDAFVADSLATDGPLRRAITASGGRPGHSRRGRR